MVLRLNWTICKCRGRLGVSHFLWAPRKCNSVPSIFWSVRTGDSNSCPPVQELGGLTKELASLLLAWVSAGLSTKLDIFTVAARGPAPLFLSLSLFSLCGTGRGFALASTGMVGGSNANNSKKWVQIYVHIRFQCRVVFWIRTSIMRSIQYIETTRWTDKKGI